MLPARELLGEMLLQLNEPALAIEAFEKDLKINPNRASGMEGLVVAKKTELKLKLNIKKIFCQGIIEIFQNNFLSHPKNLKMQRNSFFKLCISAGLMIVSPISSWARRMRTQKGIFVQAGKDRFNKALTRQPGDIIFNKVSSSDTDGDLYIMDTTRIKEGGPPLHYHYNQDEWWYVVKGEFLIRVGEETFHATTGDCVFGPRKIPHTFAKIGEGEAKIILLFQPAGKMEDFFHAVNDGKFELMSDYQKNEFRKEHGFEHIGPPLKIPPNGN